MLGSDNGLKQAPTQPALVYLYGPPAAGKLTVGEHLAAITGYRLFHNHLTVNAIRAIFEFNSQPFTDVLHRLRLDVFETAARVGASLIFTNNSAWPGDNGRARFEAFAENAAEAVASGGGRTLFVQLTAPLAALEARLDAESRRAHRKLTDVVRLRAILAAFDPSPLHHDDLTINTATVAPADAAATIAHHLHNGADPVPS